VLAGVDFGDREAVNIVAAPGEETDDPCEHAGLVVDKHGQRAALDRFVSVREKIG